MCFTGPYWALLSLYRSYFAFVHGRTHGRTYITTYWAAFAAKKEDLFENKCEPLFEALVNISVADVPSDSRSVFTITEKAPTLGNCTTQIKCKLVNM